MEPTIFCRWFGGLGSPIADKTLHCNGVFYGLRLPNPFAYLSEVSMVRLILIIAFCITPLFASAREASPVIRISFAEDWVKKPPEIVKGSGSWRNFATNNTGESALSEAMLRCGQKRFQWDAIGFGHGNSMLINNEVGAVARIKCAAALVPFSLVIER
ncbi:MULTISPECIES: hypothetical protein [Sphingobium]|uniref:hypothetical protein n=1 Tax=Sphingobium TaxID=165695 RepID=UPI00111D0D61|nr:MULTISPECIES: hypothetical protein [Sphingobium]